MADIELVIKIPEKWFNDMIKEEFTKVDELCAVIQHSTPLPKGHGDLIDRDKLVYDCSLGDGGCDRICRCDGCSYNIIRETTINKAPTIIEADKGESE